MATRKGDLFAVEIEWRTVVLSGIAGASGHVRSRTSWHIVKAQRCTKDGKLVEVIDADGVRYKMCEKLREVRRVMAIPVDEVDPETLWAESSGLSFESRPALRVWAEAYRVGAIQNQRLFL